MYRKVGALRKSVSILDLVFPAYVILCLYTPLLAVLLPVGGINLLDDLMFFILIALCVVQISSGFARINPVVFIIPAYVLISCIISYFNGESALVILLSLKNLKNIFLFIVIACLVKDHTDFIERQIALILYASIPVTIVQFFLVTDQDEITGLFGPFSTSLYSFLAIAYIITRVIRTGFSSVGLRWLIFIPVFLNETKITFILFPLILTLSLFLSGRLRAYHLMGFFVTGVIGYVTLNALYYSLYGYEFSEVFTYDFLDIYLFEYTSLHTDVPRFFRIDFAINHLFSSDLFSFLFGHGLGAEYVGDSGMRLGMFSQTLQYTLLNQGTRVQIFQLLIDFGFVGTFVFIGALIYMMYLLVARFDFQVVVYPVVMIVLMVFSLVYQNMFFTKQLSFVLFYMVYIYIQKCHKLTSKVI